MVPTEEYLSGKVRKWTLPQVSPGPRADEFALKRLVLAQGELAQIYDAEEGIRYLACIELIPGTVRGNHFHKHKLEWVYVLSGSTNLHVKETGTDQVTMLQLGKGDLVFVATGVAHALQVTGAGEAIEFSPVRYDASDVYQHPVV